MTEGRMNLAALQQRDPYITDIIDTASQVALYTFGFNTNEWEKTSIEGSLFVYKRTASPINGFMILNRMGLNNLIEPIIKDLEFQLQDPFLLYRNSESIYGIWFYDKDECARIGQLMNSLLQLAIENRQAKSNNARQRRASESDTMQDRFEMIGPESKAIDIVQMLYKAQHEYDKSKGAAAPPKKVDPKPLIDNPNAAATKSSDLIRPMPLKLGGHPDSPEQGDSNPNPTTPTPAAPITLETLFRNASMRQQQGAGLNFAALPDMSKPPPPVSRSVSMSEAEGRKANSRGGDLPILLKHLFGSGSMVEDIERRHRGEIPMAPPSQPVAMATTANPPIKINTKSPIERLSPHIECLDFVETTVKKHSPKSDLSQSSSSKDLLDLSSLSINLTEPNQTGAYPIPVCKQLSSSTGQPKSASVPKENLLTPAKLDRISSQSQVGSTSLTAAAATLGSDVLLSPMAFVRSSRKSPPVPSEQVLNLSELVVDKSKESETLPVAALTRDQLQQALLHLIKNDCNFIDTLHEAYLKSLKDLAGPR